MLCYVAPRRPSASPHRAQTAKVPSQQRRLFTSLFHVIVGNSIAEIFITKCFHMSGCFKHLKILNGANLKPGSVFEDLIRFEVPIQPKLKPIFFFITQLKSKYPEKDGMKIMQTEISICGPEKQGPPKNRPGINGCRVKPGERAANWLEMTPQAAAAGSCIREDNTRPQLTITNKYRCKYISIREDNTPRATNNY